MVGGMGRTALYLKVSPNGLWPAARSRPVAGFSRLTPDADPRNSITVSHAGDAGAAFLVFECWEKRQLLHPPLHQHHPAGARGDALLAGDAGTAFLVFECREKRQLLHPPLHRHHPAGVWGDAWHAGDAEAAFWSGTEKSRAFSQR